MDIISVIVPVYKVEKYLNRCVDSILNQSYKKIEIILVDDGSPDKCPKICDQLAAKYKNIRVIHKKNGGLSSARNVGIENAIGNYICFIDSDDFIDKNMISRMYDSIIRHDADLVMVQYLEVQSDKNISIPKKTKEIVYHNEEVNKAFLKLKIDSVCVGLYSRKVIGDNRFIVGKTSEDIPFNFEIFKKVKKFVYIPEKRYYYFHNPNSISNGCLDKNMLNYLHFRGEICEAYKDNTLRATSEALYARAAMGLQARMLLYGISEELNELECMNMFNAIFRKYRKSFYQELSIPLSRKISALFVFKAYKLIKMIRRARRQ